MNIHQYFMGMFLYGFYLTMKQESQKIYENFWSEFFGYHFIKRRNIRFDSKTITLVLAQWSSSLSMIHHGDRRNLFISSNCGVILFRPSIFIHTMCDSSCCERFLWQRSLINRRIENNFVAQWDEMYWAVDENNADRLDALLAQFYLLNGKKMSVKRFLLEASHSCRWYPFPSSESSACRYGVDVIRDNVWREDIPWFIVDRTDSRLWWRKTVAELMLLWNWSINNVISIDSTAYLIVLFDYTCTWII